MAAPRDNYQSMSTNDDGGKRGLAVSSKRLRSPLLLVLCTFIAIPQFASATTLSYLKVKGGSMASDVERKYGDMIETAAFLNDYDKDLITAVIVVESEGNPNATSPVGAKGLMQLMPRTAIAMGASNSRDPFQNILAGTKYLRHLEEEYSFTSPEEVLLAYNAGPVRAQRLVATDYDAREWGYVEKVMYTYRMIKSQKVDSLREAKGNTRKSLLSALFVSQPTKSYATPAPVDNNTRRPEIRTQ